MSRRSVITVLAVAVVSFMTVTGVILAGLRSARDGSGFGFGGRVALLDLNGVIGDDGAFLEDLHRFRDDPSVKAFVISINSPGGAVAPSQSMYRALRRIREESGRPVIASIGGVGASGGYYVALAADSIFALPGSITGSIGVIMEFPDASGLLEKVGVRMQVVKSAEHKDIGSPFRPVTEEDRAILTRLVQDVYGQFMDVVVEERGLSRDSVSALADGRILSGSQALSSGLIDRIGNIEDAVAAAGRMTGLGGRPRVVRPRRDRFALLDLLLGNRALLLLRELARPLDAVGSPRLEYSIPW